MLQDSMKFCDHYCVEGMKSEKVLKRLMIYVEDQARAQPAVLHARRSLNKIHVKSLDVLKD